MHATIRRSRQRKKIATSPSLLSKAPSWRAFPSLCNKILQIEDWMAGHAVQIEPGLWPRSPKNGNFSNIDRRLSAILLWECPKPESEDWLLICKSPPLAVLSASISDIFSERRTVWLEREDSNSRIPNRTRSLRAIRDIWEYCR